MINLKYSVINILSVLLSALNMFLMLRLFGISRGSDIYLLAYSILMSWHYIPYIFMGQFIQFYNDLKVESVEMAHRFYNQTLSFSFVIGCILFIVCFLFLKPITGLYTINLDNYRFDLLINLLKIMVFSNIFIPIILLTEQLFIAEKYFLQSYILRLIMFVGPVFSMLYMAVTKTPNISILATSYVLSVIISGIYGIVEVRKIIPLQLVFKTKNFKKFITNSFTMFVGNAIYYSLFPVVLNNYLVNFSNGIISCFYYSKNAIEATGQIANDYSNKKLLSELSLAISNKNVTKIKNIIEQYLRISPAVFLICSLLIYFLLPVVLKIIFYHSTFSINVGLFTKIFISLVIWYIVLVFTNPYSTINALSKKSIIIIMGNTIFVCLVALYLKLCVKSIFNISISMLFAQIILFITYFYFAKRYLTDVDCS